MAKNAYLLKRPRIVLENEGLLDATGGLHRVRRSRMSVADVIVVYAWCGGPRGSSIAACLLVDRASLHIEIR